MRKSRAAGLPFLFWLSSGTAQLPSESQNPYDTVVDGRFFFHLHSLGFANIMARVNSRQIYCKAHVAAGSYALQGDVKGAGLKRVRGYILSANSLP